MTSESTQHHFAALADPTRRAILARLVSGGASVTGAGRTVRHQPACHFQTPEGAQRAGLIARGREAQWRPCRLEAGPLKNVADWVEDYRRFWKRVSIVWTMIFAN